MDELPEFVPFGKIARWSREIFVTEKIDGTNAGVLVTQGCRVIAASRSRWITPDDDNHGFAKWVAEHESELLQLGPGMHWGEWWGQGIQRRYGLSEKRFSLFNIHRWRENRPACCSVVPVLYQGPVSDLAIAAALAQLETRGSVAAPGFMNPEGVIIYHTAGDVYFKKTSKRDDVPKSKQ